MVKTRQPSTHRSRARFITDAGRTGNKVSTREQRVTHQTPPPSPHYSIYFNLFELLMNGTNNSGFPLSPRREKDAWNISLAFSCRPKNRAARQSVKIMASGLPFSAMRSSIRWLSRNKTQRRSPRIATFWIFPRYAKFVKQGKKH